MTNYTWTAGYPDWITDPNAWSPNGLPTTGDGATISTGIAYDWNASTPAYYSLGNANPTQIPWLVMLGTTAMGGQVTGYANVINYGNSLFNAYIGTGAYWTPNPGGYLNYYNYGTLYGNITVLTVGNSQLNLEGGGSFGGSINFASGYHAGNSPSSIQNNLLPNTSVNDGSFGAGNGPGTTVTFSGRADASDVFNLAGGAALNLTQMQFLPSVNLESDFSKVTFDNYFSNNLQATYHNNVLTIRDFSLGRALSLNVTEPTYNFSPGGLTLFEPAHSGSLFYGLTLEYSGAYGPGTLHPLVY